MHVEPVVPIASDTPHGAMDKGRPARRFGWHAASEACVGGLLLLCVAGDILLPRGMVGFIDGRDGTRHENAWRMARAPALIREASKGRPQTRIEYDERARAFDVRAREWIGIGSTVDGAVRKLLDGGFNEARPYQRVPDMDTYFWPYDADVYCHGAGYVVSLAQADGIVTAVTGKQVGPQLCE